MQFSKTHASTILLDLWGNRNLDVSDRDIMCEVFQNLYPRMKIPKVIKGFVGFDFESNMFIRGN